jgi:hypothetical protein
MFPNACFQPLVQQTPYHSVAYPPIEDRPLSVRYPLLFRCHGLGSAVAFPVFPIHGSILRRIPSLLAGSLGSVRPLSIGTMNALRLPTALGLRFVCHFTLATRLTVSFAQAQATVGSRLPGLVQPV